MVGSTASVRWREIALVAGATAVVLPAVALALRSLSVLQLGDDLARGLGVRVDRQRLVLLGAAVALVAGRQILTFFYTPEYASHLNVFVLYLAAGGAGYVASFLGYGITAARYFKIQTVTLGSLSVVTLVTCAWLVPAYGAAGAGWSALLVAFGNILGNLLILRHALRALPADCAEPSLNAVSLPTIGTDL